MLNSYVNNSLNINAVAGTLVKNHPQSIFITVGANSSIFDKESPYFSFKTESGMWENINCVVLQAMIISDGLLLCEVVDKRDFCTIEDFYNLKNFKQG